MITPLKKTALHDLLNKPVLFDANIFMVGISDRVSDKNCSFENMKKLYIEPLFESFTDIYIHEEVYKELDDESKAFVDTYTGKNVTIVNEGNLYGRDPKYTTIFNNIAGHELVNYVRGRSKDCSMMLGIQSSSPISADTRKPAVRIASPLQIRNGTDTGDHVAFFLLI